MTAEKKYVLERDRYAPELIHLKADGRTVASPGMDLADLVSLLRTHPDVEDRTQLSFADVPVGTAGTATMRGGEGVRVMRIEGFKGVRFWAATDGLWRSDESVTDFKPDVVVDEALIGRVVDTIRGQLDDRYAWVAETVAAALRGQS